MNVREINKLNSYNLLSELFDQNRKKFESYKGALGIILKFQAIYQDLHAISNQNETGINNLIDSRHETQQKLLKGLWSLNQAILAWSTVDSEKTGIRTLKISKSVLYRKKEGELLQFAKENILRFKEAEKSIVPFLKDTSLVGDLEKSLEDFASVCSSLKEARSKSIKINAGRRDKIKELDLYTRTSIDPVMNLFRENDPAFFKSFSEARRIKVKTYTAQALFRDIVMANSTQTLADINYQPNNWLLIKNLSRTPLTIHLSMIRDIALGEGVTVPAGSTIYRQLKNIPADSSARYLIAKNDDRKGNVELEIWMGG